MGRYVIGDIHGCIDELRQLVDVFPLNTSDQSGLSSRLS